MFAERKSNHGLIDYKFFCFDGKVKFLYVMGDRNVGNKVNVSIFNRQFKKLKVSRVGDKELKGASKPDNYERLVKAAETLAVGFPHVRVDLYDQDNDIRFGEMTFYNASGYMKYNPDSFDYHAGKFFSLRT